MSKCVTNFLDKYNVDVLTDTGVRNPMRIPEAIGESYYYVNDEAEARAFTPIPCVRSRSWPSWRRIRTNSSGRKCFPGSSPISSI